MTDGQSECCALNGPFPDPYYDPDYDPDLPFGREYERRRLDRQEEEQRPGWVEETRRLIKEQDAGQRKQ